MSLIANDLGKAEPMPETFEVSAAEGLTQCLLRHGVSRIFGLPGGYFTIMYEVFRRAGLINFESRHEGAASCMAAGYALASGGLGVLHVQSGPGSTNAVTGVAAAYMDSIPLLLIMANAFRDEHGGVGHQEATGLSTLGVDQLAIYKPMTHFAARPPDPASFIRMTRTALTTAILRSGPVALDVASDLLQAKVKFHDLPASRIEATAIDPRGVEEVCALLREAKAPAILVGNRFAHRGGSADLVALCEEQEIPCATVNYAKGVIPEDHPLSLGVLGKHGQDAALEYFKQADLVVVLGARLNSFTTLTRPDLFRNLVHIDSEPVEIGRTMPVRVGVAGDLKATVRAIREGLRGTRHRRQLAAVVASLRRRHRVYHLPEVAEEGQRLKPPRVMAVLRQHLPRETLVVGDTGATAVHLGRYLPVYSADGFFALYALAPMGSGIPLALGVQVARPDATVVSVIGDGGFQTHAGELSVAAQHDLPVIYVIVNNGLYGSIAERQMRLFGQLYTSVVKNPDFAALARSFGCDGYSVQTEQELRTAIDSAVAARRPSVIDVRVDSEFEQLPPEIAEREAALLKVDLSPKWPFPSTRKP